LYISYVYFTSCQIHKRVTFFCSNVYLPTTFFNIKNPCILCVAFDCRK